MKRMRLLASQRLSITNLMCFNSGTIIMNFFNHWWMRNALSHTAMRALSERNTRFTEVSVDAFFKTFSLALTTIALEA